MNYKYTFLIVDDEKDIRDIIASSVEADDVKIIQAENGLQAYDIIVKGARPDAIMSDINMPRMTGIQLLEELNAIGLYIPFIYLTGFGSKKTIEDAQRLGAFHFFDKPFQIPEVQEIVREAMEFGHELKDVQMQIVLQTQKLGNQHADVKKLLEKEQNLLQKKSKRSIKKT